MPSCVVALDSISGLTNDAMDGSEGSWRCWCSGLAGRRP